MIRNEWQSPKDCPKITKEHQQQMIEPLELIIEHEPHGLIFGWDLQ